MATKRAGVECFGSAAAQNWSAITLIRHGSWSCCHRIVDWCRHSSHWRQPSVDPWDHQDHRACECQKTNEASSRRPSAWKARRRKDRDSISNCTYESSLRIKKEKKTKGDNNNLESGPFPYFIVNGSDIYQTGSLKHPFVVSLRNTYP